VCTDDSPASLAAVVRHDVEPAIEIDLEPVDSVVVVTLDWRAQHAMSARFPAAFIPNAVDTSFRL
jgi:hypothetical protein